MDVFVQSAFGHGNPFFFCSPCTWQKIDIYFRKL